MIFADLAINEPFHRSWAGTRHIWVKVDDSTCTLQGVSRPVPTDIPPHEEVIRVVGNDMTERTEHPAVKHRYTTTVSGINIGPPEFFTVGHVLLRDIMVGLAKICRYNGQIDEFYSVAEHSVLVSRIAELRGDEEAEIPALFHDAHEAYSGDYPSPQKDMVPELRPFEDGYERVVREALSLPGPDDPVWGRVREYDTIILHRELRNLRDTLPDWYDPKIEATVPAEVQPVGLGWVEAQAFFRARVHDLGWGLGGTV